MKRNEYLVGEEVTKGCVFYRKGRWHHELFLDVNRNLHVINAPRADVKWFNFLSFSLNLYGIARDRPIIIGDE